MLLPIFCAAALVLQPIAVCAQSYDLGSQAQTATSPTNAIVMVGGQSQRVSAGQAITSGQLAALNQIMHTGRQTVVLDSIGRATGGNVNFTDLGGSIQNLAVPNNVNVLGNVSTGQTLAINGNLTNAGNLFAYTTNAAIATANLAVTNLLNQGLISTVIPANLVQTARPDLNLSISALDSIFNNGTISSAGHLFLNAGQNITNSTGGVVTAQRNVNFSGSNVTNAGLINSATGNINFASPVDLLINGSGGVLQATNGSINIRDAAFAGNANVALFGGDVLSKNLNIFSGNGLVNVNIGKLTGPININAGEAHVTAATDALYLGNICLSGDPSFYNTLGSVVIGAPLVFAGQTLAIVAQTDILTTTGAAAIDTSNPAGAGGAITMIAGAQFTSTGPAAANNDVTSQLTITGQSATGGKIDLNSGTPITFIESRSTGGGGAGGTINMVAFNGSGAGSGSITLPPTVTIHSGGNGAGANGNVIVLAAAPKGTAISIGGIDTTGGASNTGTVNVQANNFALNAATLTIGAGGGITAGGFNTGGNTRGTVTTGLAPASQPTTPMAQLCSTPAAAAASTSARHQQHSP